MKIINTSPYDTRALRSIICSVYSYVRKRSQPKGASWKNLLTVVHVGARKPPGFQVGFDRGSIYVAGLRGTEWHEQLRGITTGNALTAERFAQGVLVMLKKTPADFHSRMLKKGTPVHVPLKALKKPKPPRNILQERYQRVLRLERAWQRKYKLAGTKLKKLKLVRRRYEKKHLLQEV